ncbi:MAG: adenosine deaminase [Acidaminobacter sp.]|uniref:adenosine deaminase n=1 Tax=Acidaminobacter sp. TaxID=1872102 RepID=UPI00137EFED4|nr:adenosine deaminase [Acidaminobacter sp.]MZQ97874.1 adenosine deaminase [Acidaminobacter sp.]
MFNVVNLPKIELHCHLDGSVRLSTLKELGTKENILSPDIEEDELRTLAEVPEHCPSLVDYLKRFELPLKVMQTETALARIAQELVEDASADGVRYIEIRFAPQLHQLQGLSLNAIITAVIQGAKAGEALTGTRSNIILCCVRHLSPAASIELVEAGRSFLGRGVVALDLVGDEHNFPPEAHAEAFKLAKSYGYHRTVHAGETGIVDNIRKSVALLYAERIGHGVSLEKDAALYADIKAAGIPLEMCPTSNLQTKAADSYEAHPLHRYLNDGIRVTLNTDNRTVSNITLSEETQNILNAGLSATQLKTLYRNAVSVIFDSEQEKQRLMALWPDEHGI